MIRALALLPLLLVATGGAAAREAKLPPDERGRGKIAICSWNIYVLGRSKREQAIRDIASIITSSSCDVIGIQEVFSRTAVDAVRDRLNSATTPCRPWCAMTGRATGSGTYAILYRNDRVEFLRRGGHVSGSTLSRATFHAQFRARQGGTAAFDFIVMVVHTKTGAVLGSELAAIQADFATVQARNPDEPDLIVLGDFNARPDSTPWAPLSVLTHAFEQPPDISMVRTDELNDNILWGPPTEENYTQERGIRKFDTEGTFDNGPSQREISDHRLLWARFWTHPDSV